MTRRTYSAVAASNSPQRDPTVMATTSTTSTPANSNVIDINHPLYLQNGDNPCMVIVTQLLTEQNYQPWSRVVMLALSAKLKLDLIDGSIVMPATSSAMYVLWKRCNDMVVSWLLNSISPDIRNSVVYLTIAKAIWDDLAIRFAQSNLPRVFQLKKELMFLSQGTMSVTAYFTKFRTLNDEMDDLSPIPRCSCVTRTCTCEFAAKLEVYDQMHKLSQFLMGLADHFTAVRGQLLMMKPLPSLSQAYSLMLQEEVQQECSHHVSTADSVAMNVKFYNNKGRNNTSNMTKKVSAGTDGAPHCDFCHMSGTLEKSVSVYMDTLIGIAYMVNPNLNQDYNTTLPKRLLRLQQMVLLLSILMLLL